MNYLAILILFSTIVTINCGLPVVGKFNAIKSKGATAVAQISERIRKIQQLQKQKLNQLSNNAVKFVNAKYAQTLPFIEAGKNFVLGKINQPKPILKPSAPITFRKTFFRVFKKQTAV